VRRVAVFGGSQTVAGQPVYETARRLGRALAEAGFEIVTGGYGGVMEAASRGARDAGGSALGVTCEIFSARNPNEYLSATRLTKDLHERTRDLIELSQAYVVLPGKTGTLAELAFLWALDRAGSLGGKPVLLIGDPWEPLLRHLARWEMLDDAQRERTTLVARVEDAVPALLAALEAAGAKE
jgi:uncharacterized protein (TIGR00730 family)